MGQQTEYLVKPSVLPSFFPPSPLSPLPTGDGGGESPPGGERRRPGEEGTWYAAKGIQSSPPLH